MFSALEKNTIEQIGTVLNLISIHNSSISGKNSKARELIKVYSTASTITRLYAILEGFVSEAVADYLDYLSNEKKFASLPDKFKEHYRIGFSNVLKKTHHESYKYLNHKDLVNWYYDALSNKFPFKFIPQAFTSTENNFRFNTIESIFNKIQLSELKSWIDKSDEIRQLYSEEKSIAEQLESELNDFVKLRNDASHSNNVDINGPTVLMRYCELIHAIIITLSGFLRKEVLNILVEEKKYVEIGVITEVFFKSKASILKLHSNMGIKRNEKLYVLNKSSCYEDLATSLQVEGFNASGVKSKLQELEVGIKMSILPKRNSRIIKLKN